jgi:hypothetical protein
VIGYMLVVKKGAPAFSVAYLRDVNSLLHNKTRRLVVNLPPAPPEVAAGFRRLSGLVSRA